MAMRPFFTEFDDLALRETRDATVKGYKGLPDGSYAFLEWYCDEPDCDCRYVRIVAISRDTGQKPLATINYGWESIEFYKNWLGDDEDVEGLKGPALAPAKQTELAPYLLELFKVAGLEDEDYVKRLRRHYRMFKQAIKTKNSPSSSGQPAPNRSRRRKSRKRKSRRKSV